MIRYFLVLAVTGMSLLTADFVLGFFAAGAVRGPDGIARAPRVVLAGDGRGTARHSLDRLHLLRGDGEVGQGSRDRLPVARWFNTQAKKNKRRAFRFVFWSMTTIAVAAWLGGAADTLRHELCDLAPRLGGLALAFNLGSFVVEYAVIVVQVRLLTELKDRADRLREARYGLDPKAV